MKKYITLFTAASACVLLLAQSKMNFHIGSLIESFNITDVDTIRFNNGVMSVEGPNKSYQVANVDSATFSLEQTAAAEGDTVFVTYNGNNVTIDNPYSSITATSTGANVVISSAANTKGIVYCLSGTSTDGSFAITPDRGFTLCLDNLNLTSTTTAPIAINEAANGESYVATVHMRGASTIADGTTSTLKGAFYTKSKLKISDDTLYSNTSLTIKGNYKHAINSAKRIELYSGKLNITGAASDGINADGVEVYGGELAIAGTSGDGVDCSEVVRIAGGTVNVTSSADDTKGLKSDSIFEMTAGTVTIDVNGAGSKAVKADQLATVSGGTLTANLNATSALVTSSDTSFNAAITSNGDVEISGSGSVIVKGAGIAARGLSADGNVNISGGSYNANLTGYYSINGTDTTSVFGIKADNKANISNGTVSITTGDSSKVAKGIKADYVYITGGNITIDNEGGYWYSSSASSGSSNNPFAWAPGGMGGGGQGGWGGGGSSTSGSSVNSSTPKCIRGDQLVSITGGTLNLTCAHGKGVTSDNSIVIGTKNGSDSDLSLTIVAGTSSDATYTKSGENSRTKYCAGPKALNCENTIEINSGTIDCKVYDSGIKAKDVTVNGGKITIDAQYDQGIHGQNTLTVNGGDIYVSNSYEAFEGITITMNGGVTSIYASNDGWNASVSSSGLSGTPSINIKGGYHYLNVGSGDTDCLDSNGGMSFSGGVLIVEGGSTLDGGDGNYTFSYTGGKLMLFGSGVENSPSGATTTSGSAGSSNTRYTAASSDGTVLSSFTTAKSSNTLYYLYSSSVTLSSGGTVSNPTTTVNFRWSNGSTLTYTEGGSISGNSTLSSSGSGSQGGWGGGW